MADEFLNLKCPNCGDKEIAINTNSEDNDRYQCVWCGKKGGRKIFTTKDDGKGNNYNWEDYGDFQT